MNNKLHNAFTLLEVLVVLAITSITAVLLVTMLEQTRLIAFRLQEQQDVLSYVGKAERWFRHTISRLAPTTPGPQHQFWGEPTILKGQSLAPLTETRFPQTIEWVIVPSNNGVSLQYKEDENIYWEIISVEGASAQFFYKAKDGQWHERWPPDINADQLPEAVMLTWQGDRMLLPWLVYPFGRKNRMPNSEGQ